MTDTALLDRLRAAVDAGFAEQTAFLTELVRFPSVRGEEAPLQDWMARQLAGRGYSVDRYVLGDVEMGHLSGFSPVMDTDYSRAVQVVGTRRAAVAAGRSLIIQGHVDVVPTGPTALWSTPPFGGEVQGEWLQGRGAGDMKQGVSAMVFALDAIRAAGLELTADVYLQSVTEEECTGNGALSTLARDRKSVV